jgi:hypothetical protein
MPDKDEPDDDVPENDESDDESRPDDGPRPGDDPSHFGIDLGHRGVRPDEVDPRDIEPPPKARPTVRTLTERLASAAADRDDADRDAATTARDEDRDEDD